MSLSLDYAALSRVIQRCDSRGSVSHYARVFDMRFFVNIPTKGSFSVLIATNVIIVVAPVIIVLNKCKDLAFNQRHLKL